MERFFFIMGMLNTPLKDNPVWIRFPFTAHLQITRLIAELITPINSDIQVPQFVF